MNEVQIIGTGSYVPAQIITNDHLSTIVETNDEWISSRTALKKGEYQRRNYIRSASGAAKKP